MYIHELRLATDQLDGLRDFYGRVLGLAVLATPGDQLELAAGATRLSFRAAEGGTRPFYHFAFNIPPGCFAEAKDWIGARVPLIANRSGEHAFYADDWDAHNVYFYDPAGNIVELIARHTLAAPDQRPFSAKGLLCISEIGVAADDVAAVVRQVQAELGSAPYRDPGSDTFAAVGDEHGLLIIVRQGRVWFPDTGKAAVVAPFEAVVSEQRDGPRSLVAGPPLAFRQLTPGLTAARSTPAPC